MGGDSEKGSPQMTAASSPATDGRPSVSPLAERLFGAVYAEADLETMLESIGIECERTSWDHYDCSLELHDMPEGFRLSGEQQNAISDAGFVKCYVNHANKWETHYTWKMPFESIEGWRVSYPYKRGTDNSKSSIWVERRVDGWPAEWFDTGYVTIMDASAPIGSAPPSDEGGSMNTTSSSSPPPPPSSKERA